MSEVNYSRPLDDLASLVMLADPHDLMSVNKIIKLFGEIAEGAEGDSGEGIKSIAAAAVNLAEEMIIQQGEQAVGSMNLLGQTVSALQVAIRDGFQAALKILPPSLGLSGSASPRLPLNVDEKIFAEFLSHQGSVLEEMEGYILDIEKQGFASKKTAALKRVLHTIKGEAGMLGLTDVQKVCHETESYLEEESKKNTNNVDNLLAVKDWLSQTFDALANSKNPPPVDDVMNLLHSQKNISEQKDEVPQKPELDEKKLDVLENVDISLMGEFITEARGHLDNADLQLLTIENNSEDKEALNAVFRSFHTIKGSAGFLDLKEISELAHVAEDLLDKARKGNLRLSGGAIDTIFDTLDTLRRLLSNVEEALSSGGLLAIDSSLPGLLARLKSVVDGKTIEAPALEVDAEKKLGEILVDAGKIKPESLAKALSEKKEGTKTGEVLVKECGVPAKDVAGALRAQQVARGARETLQVKESVKIDTERLDKLLDAIGEMVIAESMVSQDEEILRGASNRVGRNLGHLHKITRVVQEMGMSMRMVTVRPTFQKMARLVRDLGKKSGKEVEFVTSGEDTELDRSVVEQIGDPLIHLLRNSVDHGIEDSPEERTKLGKPAVSRIELHAYHQSGSIFIEVSDDGRGLDKEAIIAKGKERGIITNDNEMGDTEIFQLIFAPGFSTAKKVTDVSGRGVGMDVVKRNIEALRGNIDLMSEPGKGTTVSMRLPLTLAIIDGMIIRVGAERFIIPTLSVVESLRPRHLDLSTVAGRGELLSVRGALMPLFRISRIFEIPGAIENPGDALAMIVENGGHHIALLVDALIGQQQVVIKNLGEGMGKVRGISGSAIMSDGRVGLILDILQLVKLANSPVSNRKVFTREARITNGDSQGKESLGNYALVTEQVS